MPPAVDVLADPAALVDSEGPLELVGVERRLDADRAGAEDGDLRGRDLGHLGISVSGERSGLCGMPRGRCLGPVSSAAVDVVLEYGDPAPTFAEIRSFHGGSRLQAGMS